MNNIKHSDSDIADSQDIAASQEVTGEHQQNTKEGAKEAVQGTAGKGTEAKKEEANEAVQCTASISTEPEAPFQKTKDVAQMLCVNCTAGKLYIKPKLAMLLLKDPELSRSIVLPDVNGVHQELVVKHAKRGGPWMSWTSKCFQNYLVDSFGNVWGNSDIIMPSSSASISSGATDATDTRGTKQPPLKKARSE